MDQTIPPRHRWTEFGLQLEVLYAHGALQNGVAHGVTIVTPMGPTPPTDQNQLGAAGAELL